MTSTKVIIREAQSEDAQGVLNYLKFITNETSNPVSYTHLTLPTN